VAVERLTPLAALRDEAHITDETTDATGALCSATLTRDREASLVDTTVTDISEMLEQRRASASGSVASLAPQDTLPSSPELQAIEAELERKHWDAWLETKVPALGNRTPRQAAKSASGRERLEALLASYGHNQASGRNVLGADIAALKQRLGLT
jgi:hypothetical protein